MGKSWVVGRESWVVGRESWVVGRESEISHVYTSFYIYFMLLVTAVLSAISLWRDY